MSDLPPGVSSALNIDMDGDKDAKYLVCQQIK